MRRFRPRSPPAPGSPPRPRFKKPKDPFAYAVWLLGRREWGAQELRQRLAQRECTPEEIEGVLTRLQAAGFQSDERAAHSRARSQGARRGDRWVRADLNAKGLTAEVAAQALAALPPEAERARKALAGLPTEGPWGPALQQKAWRRLASRGFGPEAIRKAITAHRQGVAEEDPEGVGDELGEPGEDES